MSTPLSFNTFEVFSKNVSSRKLQNYNNATTIRFLATKHSKRSRFPYRKLELCPMAHVSKPIHGVINNSHPKEMSSRSQHVRLLPSLVDINDKSFDTEGEGDPGGNAPSVESNKGGVIKGILRNKNCRPKKEKVASPTIQDPWHHCIHQQYQHRCPVSVHPPDMMPRNTSDVLCSSGMGDSSITSETSCTTFLWGGAFQLTNSFADLCIPSSVVRVKVLEVTKAPRRMLLNRPGVMLSYWRSLTSCLSSSLRRIHLWKL